eukprot:CAMPEP_0119316358 /NCGR_PEP_ID=MMETSP1333-20130426/39431_1 /TAXON_ID=418940 /ORGANISM="Scyphosphaera apsteinii, Strain RCC1455" /LENGTH=218 /DNA_ID=CAMNT_0007321979 /DNA_START=87 /DNA_END=743 /DNA_ORIENTATION=-
MSPRFFTVHHTFKAEAACQFWETFKPIMANESARCEALSKHEEFGVYLHSFLPVTHEGPVFSTWEAKPGITSKALQAFLDGDDALMMGLMNNTIYPVDLELAGGLPFPLHFVDCEEGEDSGDPKISAHEREWLQHELSTMQSSEAAGDAAVAMTMAVSPGKLPTKEEQAWLERQLSNVSEADEAEAWLEKQAVEAALADEAVEAARERTANEKQNGNV